MLWNDGQTANYYFKRHFLKNGIHIGYSSGITLFFTSFQTKDTYSLLSGGISGTILSGISKQYLGFFSQKKEFTEEEMSIYVSNFLPELLQWSLLETRMVPARLIACNILVLQFEALVFKHTSMFSLGGHVIRKNPIAMSYRIRTHNPRSRNSMLYPFGAKDTLRVYTK